MSVNLEISLRELIGTIDASSRLANAALEDPLFETTTVAAFLKNKEAIITRLAAVRNMGRKTIQELVTAVERHRGSLLPVATEALAAEPVLEDEESSALAQLPSEVLAISLRTLVARVGASVRLTRAAAKQPLFDATDVRMYLTLYGRHLPNVPNLGRTSTAELASLVNDYVACAGQMLDAMTADAPVHPLTLRPVATIDEALQLVFSTLASRRFARSDSVTLLPAQDGAYAAVAALSKNAAFVIRRRYGLQQFDPMTLSEVATEASVTRERVRQVEAKALQAMRIGAASIFGQMLNEQVESMWKTLSGGRPVITSEAIAANRNKLAPLQRLAIDVLHESVADWVAGVGVESEEGWLLNADEREGLAEDVVSLRLAVSSLALPRPLADIASLAGLEVERTRQSLRAVDGLKCEGEFVHRGFVGARARRAALLYGLAMQSEFPTVFDIQTLADRHRLGHPDDPVASRMILKELQEHPHLFSRLFDGLWVVLPHSGAERARALADDPLPFERRAVLDDGGFDEGSIGKGIVQELAANGPRRLSELQDLASERESSSTSVGPILLMNSCFQRVMPGIYGLYSGESGPTDVGMTVQQCRHYAFARFGGAPRDYFPGWSVQFEQALCRWAQYSAPADIFRSLMFVASPEDWSLASDELSEWLESKKTHAAWKIGSSRRIPLGNLLPDPDAFFSALSHVVLFGSTSWYGINRSVQQKLDSQEAADVLALLIGMDLVVAPDDWQAPHVGTARAVGVLEKAERERWARGSLSWRSGILADLLPISSDESSYGFGWLPRAELRELLQQVLPAEGAFRRVTRAIARDDAELDGLLDSQEWAELFKS